MHGQKNIKLKETKLKQWMVHYMKGLSRQVNVRDMHIMMMMGVRKFHENQ